MRIWDLPVNQLCDKHLLGEHNELHIINNTIQNNRKGWANHPEVKRWKDNTTGLYLRHNKQIKEMEKRGFKHNSPLAGTFKRGKLIQWQDFKTQISVIKNKKCNCKI